MYSMLKKQRQRSVPTLQVLISLQYNLGASVYVLHACICDGRRGSQRRNLSEAASRCEDVAERRA